MLRRIGSYVGIAIPCLVIAFAGSAALAQDKPKEEPKKPEPKKEEPKKEEPKKEGKDVLTTLGDNKDFSTLVGLIKDAGLDSELKSGDYTIFAATNAAFDKLGKDKLDELKKDKTKLANVLKGHIATGKLMKADLEKNKDKTIKTKGGDVKVTQKDGKWMVESATVTATDTVAKNGVIHTIDAVIMIAPAK